MPNMVNFEGTFFLENIVCYELICWGMRFLQGIHIRERLALW